MYGKSHFCHEDLVDAAADWLMQPVGTLEALPSHVNAASKC